MNAPWMGYKCSHCRSSTWGGYIGKLMCLSVDRRALKHLCPDAGESCPCYQREPEADDE